MITTAPSPRNRDLNRSWRIFDHSLTHVRTEAGGIPPESRPPRRPVWGRGTGRPGSGRVNIVLAAVGTRMPGWVDTAFRDYAKTPSSGLPALAPRGPRSRTAARRRARVEASRRACRREGEGLLRVVPNGARIVALDERGAVWSTAELTERLGSWLAQGRDTALLAGGPDGLAPACLARGRAAVVAVPAHPPARAGAGNRRGAALAGVVPPQPSSLPPGVTRTSGPARRYRPLTAPEETPHHPCKAKRRGREPRDPLHEARGGPSSRRAGRPPEGSPGPRQAKPRPA